MSVSTGQTCNNQQEAQLSQRAEIRQCLLASHVDRHQMSVSTGQTCSNQQEAQPVIRTTSAMPRVVEYYG